MRIKGSKKHGLSKTPFYQVWTNMKSRCFYKKDKKYKYYGGKGITVCDEWLNFLNFRDDMYESYLKHKTKHHTTTIERINGNSNYCPSNCCFATREEQFMNTQCYRNYILKNLKNNIMITAINTEIPRELKRMIKMLAVSLDKTFKQVVVEALTEKLESENTTIIRK